MTSTAPCWICRACNNATPTMQMSSDVHRVSTLERLKRFFGRESAQPLS